MWSSLGLVYINLTVFSTASNWTRLVYIKFTSKHFFGGYQWSVSLGINLSDKSYSRDNRLNENHQYIMNLSSVVEWRKWNLDLIQSSFYKPKPSIKGIFQWSAVFKGKSKVSVAYSHLDLTLKLGFGPSMSAYLFKNLY